MVLGLGMDVIQVDRLRKAVDRHGKHFLDHVYTEYEQSEAPDGDGRYAYFVGRWAVKEAISKMLGTGIGEHCAWTDIRVQRLGNGRPHVELTGRARKTAERLGIRHIHVTISHDGPLACAAAIGEGSPCAQ